MTYTPFNDDETYRPKLPDLWEWNTSYAPHPGYLDQECTPSATCLSPDAEDVTDERSSLHKHQSDRVGFHLLVESEDEHHACMLPE
jgi:hypothetical protein